MTSKPSALTLFKVRRIVDSQGFSPETPSLAKTAGVVSAAHSAMATKERAPAITAQAATAKMLDSRCLRPRAFLGSGTDRRARSNAAGAAGMSGNSSSSNWSTTV